MAEPLRGRYRVVETLGAGGEARVVKAVDLQHDRVVALKIRPVRGAEARHELLAEARLLLALAPHPALPLVREDFFDGGDYVIAMDWVDGTDLETLLREGGRPGLAPSSVLAYLADAAEALTHLHVHDPPVIHGDVKPANLILTRGGRVVLVDFGRSSLPWEAGRPGGTPGFTAPELGAGERPSRASDVYSLAATAFALLTGAPPSGAHVAWEGLDPAQAAALEASIRLGLATNPARRPSSAGELVERIRAGWGQTLPTGVVTLLLSDVEGSTRLWEDDPAAMTQALVRHDSLIAASVEHHGGRFLKSMGEGDSTVSVFDSAEHAVRAVVHAHHALGVEEWPGRLGLRVRFGLHTGEAEQRGSDYFGPTVNVAARLREQADGGQVFLSSTTASLVRRHLPPGCTLVDLGPHRLRGVAEPVRVYALAGPGLAAPLPATECPYRGLLAFEPDDRWLFFGRETVVENLTARVRRARFTALVGASGSGKSSVLRAGLVAAIRAREVAGIERVALVTPAAGLGALGDDDPASTVIVDQFEELFTGVVDQEARQLFLEHLLARRSRVVVAVRADFYGLLGAHPRLARLVAENHVLLGAMTADELRAAITEPARRAGLRFEPGLVDLVLSEVGDEPGGLPLLSHALQATWGGREGRTLTVAAYRASGGVGAAIATTADSVTGALTLDERRLLRNVMLRLTQPGEGPAGTRRRVPVHELVEEGSSEAEVRALLARLADARLVTLDHGTAAIAHEALVRGWPALQSWLADDRDGLRLRRRLGDAARVWADGGREASDLYRGHRLEAAREWASSHPGALNAIERAFIEAGAREQARSTRRLRRLFASTAALLLVAVAAATLAFVFGERADERAREATIQRLAAQSQAIGDADLVTSSLLAVEAARRERSALTRSALYAALQVAPRKLRYAGAAAPSGSAVAVSDDGRVVAVSHGGRVEFLDGGTLEPSFEAIEPDGGTDVPLFVSFAMSGDGRFVVASGPGNVLERWDVRGHRRTGAVPPPAPGVEITGMDISDDGSRVVVADSTNAVSVLDAELERIAGPVSLGRGAAAPSVSFCRGDSMIATMTLAESGAELRLTRRDARTLEPAGPVMHAPGVGEASLHCDDRSGLLTAAAFNGPASVFDAATGARVAGPVGDRSNWAVATPDGRAVLVLDRVGSLRTFDARGGSEIGAPVETGLARAALAVSPDGARAFVSGVRLLEVGLGGGTPLGSLVAGTAGAVRVSTGANPWELAIVVHGPDGPTTRFVDTRNGRQVAAVAGYAEYVGVGGEIFTLGLDGVGSLGTPTEPGARWRRRLADPSTRPGFVNFLHHRTSPSGRLAAVKQGPGELLVVDVASGRVVAGPLGEVPRLDLVAVAFSPDDRLLATYALDHDEVVLIDPRRGTRVGQPIGGLSLAGGAMAFSPDGRRLVIGGSDGDIRIVDVARRELEPKLLEGHSARAIDFAVLGEGVLVSASIDGTVRFWDLESGLPLGRPLAIAGPPVLAAQRNARVLQPTAEGVMIPTPDGVLAADLRAGTLVERVCARAGQNLPDLAFAQYLPGEGYRLTCARFGEPPAALGEG